jgi:hypothetical protein
VEVNEEVEIELVLVRTTEQRHASEQTRRRLRSLVGALTSSGS